MGVEGNRERGGGGGQYLKNREGIIGDLHNIGGLGPLSKLCCHIIFLLVDSPSVVALIFKNKSIFALIERVAVIYFNFIPP